jgi:hypothetical protein
VDAHLAGADDADVAMGRTPWSSSAASWPTWTAVSADRAEREEAERREHHLVEVAAEQVTPGDRSVSGPDPDPGPDR